MNPKHLSVFGSLDEFRIEWQNLFSKIAGQSITLLDRVPATARNRELSFSSRLTKRH